MQSQSNKQVLVWGGLLIFFGAIGLVEAMTDLSDWAWFGLLVIAGFVVFGVYLMDRTEWTVLIPAYVMWAVAGLIALTRLEILQDEFVAMYVLTAIGLPFLVVFLRERSQRWALIPAYVLLAVGLMVALIGQDVLDDLLIPAYVMFAIAIPFLFVYARDPRQWWPLIPGGILAVIGASFLVAGAAVEYILPAGLLLAGVVILARQFIRRGDVASDVPLAAETASDPVSSAVEDTGEEAAAE